MSFYPQYSRISYHPPRTTNERVVYQQIQDKIGSSDPYYPPTPQLFDVRTDVNVFPYQRFFRGKQDSMSPHVWEREAGYSPILASRDTTNDVDMVLQEKSSTCFQIPCTTILPCEASPNNYMSSTRSKVYTSP